MDAPGSHLDQLLVGPADDLEKCFQVGSFDSRRHPSGHVSQARGLNDADDFLDIAADRGTFACRQDGKFSNYHDILSNGRFNPITEA